MGDEVEQGAEAQTEQQTAAQPEAELTLDDVYRSAGLDQPQQPAQPQHAAPSLPPQNQLQFPQQSAPAQPQIPSAYDTEAFTQYLAQQQAGMTTLQHATLQVTSYLNQLQAEQARKQTEADVSKAVTSVNEIVKHPNPRVIEAMLDATARDNPQFKALWDSRAKNPAAWSNALKVVTRQIAKEFDVKPDAKLAESQRALNAARRQMATTAADEPDEQWNGLSQADFDARWQNLVGGG